MTEHKVYFILFVNKCFSNESDKSNVNLVSLPVIFAHKLSSSSPADHVTPERAPCLGCPEDIDENSDDIRVPLSVSISKYNSISNSTHLFTLHSVGPATRQVDTERHEGAWWGKHLLLFNLQCVCVAPGGRRFQVHSEV